MSKLNIPESWAEATVLDLVYSRGRIGWKGLKASEYKKEGPHFISVKEFEDDGSIDWEKCVRISLARFIESPEIILKINDVLLSKDGSIGKVAYVQNLPKEGATVNSSIAVITPYKGIDSKYIFYYFKGPTFQRLVKSKIMGAAIPHIFQKDLRTLGISVPPEAEQKRIVQKIESTQSKIKVIEDNVTKAEALIEKYRESLLQKAFRGELVPQNSNDEPASELLKRIRAERDKQADGKKKKKDELPPIKEDEIPFEIPKSWEWVRLADVLKKITDGTHHSPKNTSTGEYKYITAKNIKDWGLDLNNMTYVTAKVHKEIYSRCNPQLGDVFLIKDGATSGVSCINTLNEEFSMLSSVALLRTYDFCLLNEYLLLYLKSPVFQKLVADGMAGAAIKRITLSKIENMLIPLPSMEEQKRIVAEVQIKMKQKNSITKVFSEISDLLIYQRNSILAKAFEGSLVSQISSEGTGHDLLKEIQSQPTSDTASANKTKKSKIKKEKKK